MTQNVQGLIDLLSAPKQEVSAEEARMRRRGYWGTTLKIECSHPEHGPGQGSGVLLTKEGHFLTNAHVLESSQGEYVRMHGALTDEQIYPLRNVRELWSDPDLDLLLAQADLPVQAQDDLRILRLPTLAHENGQHKDEIRVYGFKYEVTEERTGKNIGPYGEVALTCGAGHAHEIRDPLFEKSGTKTWFSNASVEQGFSGGPVVLARTGELLGITKVGFFPEDDRRTTSYAHGYTNHEGIREFLTDYLRHTDF
jgi:hypothetical protein